MTFPSHEDFLARPRAIGTIRGERWVFCKHPDGRWVTWRKAGPIDELFYPEIKGFTL
jgi:hypothetical protein